MMPIVRITPQGRRARSYFVADVPRTWAIDGGCATATLPIVPDPELAERLLLAQVDVFGPTGHDWGGFVWKLPRPGEAIQCVGTGVALSFTRRRALYIDGNFLRDLKEWAGASNASRSISGGVVTLAIAQGATLANNGGFGYDYMGDVELTQLTFTSVVNVTNLKLAVYGLDANGSYTGSPYTDGTTGTATGQSITFAAGTYGFRIYMVNNTGSAITASDETKYVQLYGAKLYATAVTTVTPKAVIDDCIDRLPTWALPAGGAYRAWIGDPPVTIGDLAFYDPVSDKRIVDAVATLSDHRLGFYPRRVGGTTACVPVFAAPSSTPDVMLDVRLADTDGIGGMSADSLASDYMVRHADEDRGSAYVEVADASADNYLNELGIEKWADVNATFTTSPTLAQATGAAVAASAPRNLYTGGLAITRARTAQGAPIHPLRVMPGTLASVRGLPGGIRELIVTKTAIANGAVTVSFGATGTDLEYLARRATGATVVRY